MSVYDPDHKEYTAHHTPLLTIHFVGFLIESRSNYTTEPPTHD